MVRYSLIFAFLFCRTDKCSSYPLDNAIKNNSESTRFEICTTANNKAGKCVEIKECDALFNLLKLRPISDKNVRYLKKSQCGFVDKEPKVCCALNDEDNPSLPVLTLTTEIQNASATGNLLPGLYVCGTFVDDRLIYGKGTQLGSFPWAALLEYQKPQEKGVHCGGVLITNRYVLTAAHCVSSKNIPENWNLVSVILGEHNTTSDPDCIEVVAYTDCGPPILTVPIAEKIIHEQYDYNNINRYNDIALLRLATPVSFSEFVSPICLPPAHDEGLGMLPFAITGWGSSKDFKGFDVKRDAMLSMKSKEDCQSSYFDQIIRDDQLCAARTGDSKDTCNVDSGGALMSVNPQYSLLGHYFAVGVTSFGPKDCTSKSPIVFTKVRNYMVWIKRNMRP